MKVLASAVVCGFFLATATPVAAQTVVRTSANNIVYSVDSLESTEQPEDISLGEEVTPVDSLESNISAPADKKAVKLVINGVPTAVVMPVAAPVSTPADVMVPAVQPTAEPVSPLANTEVKTATPIAVPVVSPLVDTTGSEEVPTSVVVPVPRPRNLEIPNESRVGNPTSRSRKANPLVGTNVQVQATQPVSKKKADSKVVSSPVVGTQVNATQPTSQKADSKVATFKVQAAQPFNTIVESKAVASPLVGNQVPATQFSNLGVGSKVAVSPSVDNQIQTATQPGSKQEVASKVAVSPVVGNQVQATQPVSQETGSKVAFNPVLNTGVMNGFIEKPEPVSPSADTKPVVCDPANLENSIKVRAPDLKPSETRVAAKYSRPCSKTTATLGYSANVDQSGRRAVDFEVSQGIGNFEITAKTNLTPAIALQSAGVKWSNKKVTLEATRDFVEPSVKGKIGIEFPMFKGQPDTGLIELEVHALDAGPVDGRVAATYTRPSSQTKAVLGANFSNTSSSADLEITQGIGKNLEVTAKTGLIPTVQLQALGMKLTRGGWSLEVKRDLLERAWEGQVTYSIKF